MSSHCLQIQGVKCLLGCVLLWRRNPCPEAAAHTLLCSITQVRSHSSISSCQRRFLVTGWGLQRWGHSCWGEAALIAGSSGIKWFGFSGLSEGKDITQMFLEDICGAFACYGCLWLEWIFFLPMWAGVHLPSSCIRQTLSLALLGLLHFFSHRPQLSFPSAV